MRRLLTMQALCLLAGCLIACAGRRPNSAAPTTAGAVFEREFLRNRIAHQQAAIEMARTCGLKAVHDELKQFCGALSNTESEEASQLQDWLKQWYPTSGPIPSREADTQGYRNFRNAVQTSTGSPFEEAFLSALRLHHHEGVTESKACAERTAHPELRSYCAKMVAEQEREIKQLNSWICGWFKDCVEK